MRIAETGLYLAAKALRTSQIAHTSDMKAALQDLQACHAYRAQEIGRIVSVLRECQLSLEGLNVLDFGCNDGALAAEFLKRGAASVVGVDVDERALQRAREVHRHEQLRFVHATVGGVPLPDTSVDAAISYDVFEHVANPAVSSQELWRMLKPGGWCLIGTWSWRHPFAPHLWAVMPVPWAHLVVSERTLLKACRRVYHAPWYVPNQHDFDQGGARIPDRYTEDRISREYLNHFLIRDFEAAFASAGFACQTRTVPFGSRYARLTRPLLTLPFFREFLSGYVWFVLRKPQRP